MREGDQKGRKVRFDQPTISMKVETAMGVRLALSNILNKLREREEVR